MHHVDGGGVRFARGGITLFNRIVLIADVVVCLDENLQAETLLHRTERAALGVENVHGHGR